MINSDLTQDVWIDVATGEVVQQVGAVGGLVRGHLGNSMSVSLDKKYSLVAEVTGPVCVYLSGRENMRATEVVCVILLGAVLQCSEISPELAEFLR